MKSLSYQHPLCLSPGCYLIGFHLPFLPLSFSPLGLKLGRPRLPELLSYALSPPAIGLPIRGKWKIVFFLFFFILFLSLWQLAIYASLMPSWWYVERPHWLLLLLFFLLLCVYSHFVCSLCAAPFEQLFDYFHSICSFWVCRSQQVASTSVALAIFKKYKQRSKKNNIKNMNTK